MEFSVKGKLSYLSHILYTKPNGFFVEVIGLCKCISNTHEKHSRFTREATHIIWFRNPKLFEYHKRLSVDQCYEFKVLKVDFIYERRVWNKEIFIDTSRTVIIPLESVLFDVSLIHSICPSIPQTHLLARVESDSDAIHGVYELEHGSYLCTTYLQEVSNISRFSNNDLVHMYGVHKLMVEEEVWHFGCSRSYIIATESSSVPQILSKSVMVHLAFSYQLNMRQLCKVYRLVRRMRKLLAPSHIKCVCQFNKLSPGLIQLLGPLMFSPEINANMRDPILGLSFLKVPHSCLSTSQMNSLHYSVKTVDQLKLIHCGSWIKHLSWNYRTKLIDNDVVVGAICVEAETGVLYLSDSEAKVIIVFVKPVQGVEGQTISNIYLFKDILNKVVIIKQCYLVEEEFSGTCLRYLYCLESDIIVVDGGYDVICSSCAPINKTKIEVKAIKARQCNQAYVCSFLLLAKSSLLERKVNPGDKVVVVFILHVKIIQEVGHKHTESDVSMNVLLQVSGDGLKQHLELQTFSAYKLEGLENDIFSYTKNKDKPSSARKLMPEVPYIVLPDWINFKEATDENVPLSLSDSALSVEAACRESHNEVCNVNGLIIQRRHKRSSLSRVTGHSLCLLLQDLNSWETIWLYLTSESVRRRPALGLVPSSIIMVTNVNKIVSQKGNGYLSSTFMTHITVTGFRLLSSNEMKSYMPVPDMELVVSKPEWNNKLIKFLGVLSSVTKVQLTAICANCQRGVDSNNCTYAGCLDGTQVDVECKLSFYVTANTARLKCFAKDFVARQLLRIGSTDWKDLVKLTRARGSLNYINTLSTMNDDDLVIGPLRKICNNIDIARSLTYFCRVYQEKGFTSLYCTNVQEAM